MILCKASPLVHFSIHYDHETPLLTSAIEALQWLTACHCVSSAEGPEWSKMAANIAKTSTSTLDNPDKYALSEYTQHLDNSQQEQY